SPLEETLVKISAICCPVPEDFCYDEPHCDPYAWGDLVPSCHPLLEEHHSPIDLGQQASRNTSLGPLHLEGFDVMQTGHWTLRNDGRSSECTAYPMEMQIVNMKSVHPNLTAALDDPTGLAVLGFFIDVVYADNVHFAHISQKLSSVAYKGQTAKVTPFALMSLLPKHNLSQYYRYHSSLTTPPCSRAVVWTVYQVPVYISWSQLAQFTSQVFSTEEDAEQATPLRNNFRHIHPAFSRLVSASQDAKLLAAAAAPLQLLHAVLLGGLLSGLQASSGAFLF
uniref:Alpha-carbonic anhydrase domain-containing protein n=1 Tax=Mola mola TaxID=94237 RepID=A0A3Q4B032_MOLML